MRRPKNFLEDYELLPKYESGNETDCGGVSGSPEKRGTCIKLIYDINQNIFEESII